MEGKLLKDKVAIVTGGTRGIGRSIVIALAREGADSLFTYVKNKEIAESLVSEVSKIGRKAISIQMDVRDFEGSKTIIEKVKEEFGKVDILVNNAGITRDRSLMMMSNEDWTDVIDTDLTGVFNVTHACIITFLKQKSGTIVNISSLGGIHPLPGQSNYAAAKAGIIGFTKSLAKEVARYSIRVNAVAPGFIETDMVGHLGEKARGMLLESIPLGRLGTADEVAKVVVFLVSDRAQYITGQVIQIDGGLGI